MKKTIFIAALAAAVLAGCAKNEVQTPAVGDAVNFGAYSGRVQTKAGPTDDINLQYLEQDGFGVFATYTALDDLATYGPVDNNFMYNQLVSKPTGSATWTYSPIKYWPNLTNGMNQDDQMISFFAYAPYADPEATSADNTYGITGFAIDADGHNTVNYSFAANKPNVDLMWGYKARTGAGTTGDPYVYTVNDDIKKSATVNTPVHFIFQHMLSKLAGSQEGDPATVGHNGLLVKASPAVAPTNGLANNTGTKITISKIVLQSATTDMSGNPITYLADGQTIDGVLDLYDGEFTITTTPILPVKFSQTLSATPTGDESEIADNLKEVAGVTDFTAVNTGVTMTAVNVYKNENNPIILVPGTAPVVDVIVTYVVRTYDEKLPGPKFSEVSQEVWGKVAFPTIEKNKKYNLVMILGLDEVQFTATVEDWSNGRTDTNGDGILDENDDINVYLPENL